MKKLLLSIAIVATGFAAFAQKPAAGNITTELGLTNLLGSPVNPGSLNIPVGMLRFRYFMNEGMAIRVNLAFGSTTTKDVVDDDGATPPVNKSESTMKGSTFGIALGVEKHLEGTSNLSPYIGAEFGFSSTGTTTEVTNSANGTSFTLGDKFSISGGGVTTMALNGLIGADYYLTDKVYFGAEMGFGLFMSSTTAEMKVKNNGGENVAAAEKSTSGFGIMPNAMGVIRLGIILF